ncbi:MAG: hypothetical protein WA667_08800 [Candidatus Nitrosopolaris sp.]
MTSQKNEDVYKIQLTGNPFVDTGLAVIAHLSDCSSIDDLTLADMKSLHDDGVSLARNNIEHKSSYQLFSSNCLILQNRIEREQRIINHTKVTLAILNSIGHEDIAEKCDTCGNDRSLDLDKLVKASGYDAELKDKKKGEEKAKAQREQQEMNNETTTTYHAGRDWFPLVPCRTGIPDSRSVDNFA